MSAQIPPLPPANTRPSAKRWGTFGYLQVVIIVAMLLATLFTAWTDPGLLPDSLAQQLQNAIQAPKPVITEAGGSQATATLPPHLRIGIVSGHWGNDSGAVCDDGLREVDINQEVATRVKEALVGKGYDVDLLKEFDPRLENYQALALVSIHADSCQYINDQATGFKVAAARSTHYPEKAARLTACLRTRYAAATGLPFHPGSITSDMSSYHAFDEINSDTTAAIIETGFLNLDRQFLTQHPDLAALGIVNGIQCFINNEDIGPQNTTTP